MACVGSVIIVVVTFYSEVGNMSVLGHYCPMKQVFCSVTVLFVKSQYNKTEMYLFDNYNLSTYCFQYNLVYYCTHVTNVGKVAITVIDLLR